MIVERVLQNRGRRRPGSTSVKNHSGIDDNVIVSTVFGALCGSGLSSVSSSNDVTMPRAVSAGGPGGTSSEHCFDERTTTTARPGKDNLQFLSGRGRATRCTSCARKRSVRSAR